VEASEKVAIRFPAYGAVLVMAVLPLLLKGEARTSVNGLSWWGLFLLSAGLTLIFSMMGVLNFSHAGFYMLGAYFGYTLAGPLGFWPALVLAPLLVGVLGALFERWALRHVHPMGHVPGRKSYFRKTMLARTQRHATPAG
jgi:ABC-type branched-subunit amino acid transport system permease subunit